MKGMTKAEKLDLLSWFPDVPQKIMREAEQKLLPFILHYKNEVYCTNCGRDISDVFQIETTNRGRQYCPVCGEKAQLVNAASRFSGNAIESMANVVIYLSQPEDDNLYIRCFCLKMMFHHGEVIPEITSTELQRYAYTPRGVVRYGNNREWVWFDNDYKFKNEWTIRTKVAEPNFYNGKRYYSINQDAIKNTYLRYYNLDDCELNVTDLGGLYFFTANPGVERLMKCGLKDVVKELFGNPALRRKMKWKETEPHRMLGVTRPVLAKIREGEIRWGDYLDIRERFPNLQLETQIKYHKLLRFRYGTLDLLCEKVDEDSTTVLKYLIKQSCRHISDYDDYIRVCEQQGADVKEHTVKFPRDLTVAHDRRTEATRALEAERMAEHYKKKNTDFKKNYAKRKKLEFESGEYLVRQPVTIREIVDEGIKLHHCVGGYSARHADGILTIMFLRKKSEPDTPYYTIEVSNEMQIVQCRGYKNNWADNPKPPEIEDFEQKYQTYLSSLKVKKSRTKKAATPERMGA